MKKSHITYNTAKLAKEKKFDQNTKYRYTTDDDILDEGELMSYPECYCSPEDSHCQCGFTDELARWNGYIPAPTQSQLQNWLREEHRIDVMPTMSRFSRTYGYKIFYIEGGKTEVIDSQYIKQSFNSAFEIGLEKALKLI